MSRHRPLTLSLFALFSSLAAAADETPPVGQTSATAVASPAFCLFEIEPRPEQRTFINLGIVQYIELRPDELRISYGGGNLGSGHEFRMPLRREDEGLGYIQRMKETATRCAERH